MNAKKILVVDDVQFSLEQQMSLFIRTNCEVLSATNGQEALDIIRKERPALVVMDLYMPVMNGDECCRIVKSDPELKKTPIIMLTSARKEDDRKRCFDAGCDDFVTKPILKVEPFFEKIKKFVDIAVREHIRVPIDAEVSYFYEGKEYLSRILDVSEGGVFIESAGPLLTGSVINLIFTVPGTDRIIEAEGRVARVINKSIGLPSTVHPGMGIRFLHVTLEGARAVAEYVKTHIS